MFEIAKLTWPLTLKHKATGTFEQWCTHLWKHRDDLYVIAKDGLLYGITLAYWKDESTVYVEWTITVTSGDTFQQFLGDTCGRAFPGVQYLEYDRRDRLVRRPFSRMQALAKHKLPTL